MKRLQFSPPDNGTLSLLDYLKACLPDHAEEHLERLIWQGSVWQGKERLRDSSRSPRYGRGADLVSVWNTLYPIEEFHLDPALIMHEDEELLVVWKPEGVNTCQSVYSDLDCLTWGVQAYLARQGSSHELNTINRLDRDTQGLVLYGKNKKTEKALYGLFMNRQISKRYLAACPCLPDAPGHMNISDSFEYEGKTQDAQTFLRRIGTSPAADYWLALPQTGRTHQIRKHFLRYLAPIDGDQVYGGRPGPFLMLACVGYRFKHPGSGTSFRISCPPKNWPGLPQGLPGSSVT